MRKLKKSLFYLLVGIIVIAFSNGGVVNAQVNSMETETDDFLQQQMNLLKPIKDEKQIKKWSKYLYKAIDKGKLELQGNNYDFDNLSFFEMKDSSTVSISIPIKSPDHHDISNVAIHIDENKKELIAYTEIELKRSEQNTFQLTTYLNGELEVDEVYSDPFMTASEFEEKKNQEIRPMGVDWGGVADCLDMPRAVLLNVAYICGSVCVVTLGAGCVWCVGIALGLGGGAATSCLGDNWS
ncbi:hypothetical protein FS935_21990 [Metabacillus litoralis]|uniref:Uncharacterized protein n=1 Tax=Metabacillus litoralis TaxID=152268 RepID=A0A5C6VB06_9BACI|nr:hypothetical protein [Metabacillus litoralis]TXC81576.1 hypothetical protein FS935_21990 [Metabacillus litoralis]